MCKDTEDDNKDDSSGDPGPELVEMNDLVAEEGYEQRANSDDDDTCVAWNVIVHGVNHLSADNRVHGRPAKTGEDIEHSDCTKSVGSDESFDGKERTDLDSVPAEPVARQDHLSQSKSGAESREVTHRYYANEVEEQARQTSVREP